MAKHYYGGKGSGGCANLPQKEKMVAYPKPSYGNLGTYKDEISGIDAFGRQNRKKLESQKKN